MYCKMGLNPLGSGCGSVVRAVASDSRGPPFESSHQQNVHLLSILLKFEKTKIKRIREWSILKRTTREEAERKPQPFRSKLMKRKFMLFHYSLQFCLPKQKFVVFSETRLGD